VILTLVNLQVKCQQTVYHWTSRGLHCSHSEINLMFADETCDIILAITSISELNSANEGLRLVMLRQICTDQFSDRSKKVKTYSLLPVLSIALYYQSR